MAVSKSENKSAAEDPRHPDTVTDKGGETPDLKPEDYGFRTIEEGDAPEGPGAVEPTRVDALSSVPNSTFASRSKAIQDAENK